MVQQAYVEGVSIRRVDDLVKPLGCDGISKSQVHPLGQPARITRSTRRWSAGSDCPGGDMRADERRLVAIPPPSGESSMRGVIRTVNSVRS